MADEEMQEAVNLVTDTGMIQAPLAPSWPRDVYGMTSGLRKELVRAASRLNGDPAKLEVFMETIRCGAMWAKDRCDVQASLKEVLVADLETIAAKRQEQVDKDHATGGRNAAVDEIAEKQADAGVGPAKAG